jgi:hypothetical protein
VTGWFGEPWPSAEEPAPVCDDPTQRVSTPVGAECAFCTEQIEEGDRGTFCGNIHGGWDPVHAECQLREVLGGAGHLAAKPHAPGGCGDPDGGLSWRESALLVWEWVERMGSENTARASSFRQVQEWMQAELEARRAQRS